MLGFTPQNPDFASIVSRAFASQRFMRLIGAELAVVEAGYVEIVVPVSQDLEQKNGVIHGGIVGALADNAAGAAAATLMAPGAVSVTAEYKINFVAPAVGDRLRAKSRVIKAGKTLTVCRSEVFGVREGQEALCACALVTLMPEATD